MAPKRFIIYCKDGATEHISAAAGDEDEEADGYVFFVDSKGGIVGLFAKEVVKSWRDDAG